MKSNNLKYANNKRFIKLRHRAKGLPTIPAFVLESCAALLGKRAVAQRLCGSLQVDIDKTRRLLGWTPPLTLNEGLKKAVEGMKQ